MILFSLYPTNFSKRNLIDLGLSTTPTVEVAVTTEKANGGIVITASHNPQQWNALKLLNEKGEFINEADGADVLALADNDNYTFSEYKAFGTYRQDNDYIEKHIQMVLALPLVDIEAIRNRNFRVCVDAVNSTGGIAIPELLEALGVQHVTKLNCEPNGQFAHNPEPLKEHLTELCDTVVKEKAHLGIAVDPDVDRLCFVSEDGNLFGEEYTLVAVADYILQYSKGATVSNLSSTRALRDVTEQHGCKYFASAVGEVNVVTKMKAEKAVIGGEGNGGIIVPDLHYGRDALIGIALFLSHLAKAEKTCSNLRASYPAYFMSKKKMDLNANLSLSKIFEQLKKEFAAYPMNDVDGLKIDFENEWVHLRSSNTEPIMRIYTEAKTQEAADALADKIIQLILKIQ